MGDPDRNRHLGRLDREHHLRCAQQHLAGKRFGRPGSEPQYRDRPGATATFDTNGNTFTINGSISGSGALAVAGSGTLVLTNSDTYSGGTLVSSGALEVDHHRALPGASLQAR